MKKIFFCSLIVFILLCGCSANNNSSEDIISYIKAKEMIINEGAVLVDVRTEEEYNEKHIDGAILLSVDNINESSAKDAIKDKETVVIVYCKSGKRSHEASIKLANLGYTKVYDLGSMENWKE